MDSCCRCVGKPQSRPVLKDVFAISVFCATPVIVAFLAAVSFIPSLGAPDMPSFAEPTKGFEPRGTDLSNRYNTYQRTFHKALEHPATLTFHVPQNAIFRKRRSSYNQESWCDTRISWIEGMNKLVFKSTSGESLFNVKSLKAICALEKRIIQPTPNCPSYSIGYYVALLNNRTSCDDITEEDVTKTLSLIRNCSGYLEKELLKENCNTDETCKSKVPARCTDFNAVYYILIYLSDNLFQSTESATKLTYSLVVYRESDFLREDVYYKSLEKLTDPEMHPKENGVQLAAFSFGNMKFKIFSKKLISDVIYPAMAMALVFIIMVLYLQSIILAIHALECIIFALVISYFLYHIVFGLTFFPFLNVTSLVFLVGIGADDAFVYYDIWCQTKDAYPNASVAELTWKTLRYAALSMFVTSLTTASAFYASVSSAITAIKCFGIFAGNSILANYLMMVTFFPAVVFLHERYVVKRPAVFEKQRLPLTAEPSALKMDRLSGDKVEIGTKESNEEHSIEEVPCVLRVLDYPCVFIRPMNAFFRKIASKLFHNLLPKAVIKLRWLWFVVFLALTVGFLYVDFGKPGLQRPVSSDFQLFTSSHPLEQYDLHYKSHFRFSHSDHAESSKRNFVLIWGLKPVDNGNHLNPDDRGKMEFDNSFDMLEPNAQEWLLSLCTSIANTTFYSNPQECLMEELKLYMALPCGSSDHDLPSPCCNNSAFPYPRDVFRECLIKILLRWGNRWQHGPFFDESTKEVKGLIISYESNVAHTEEYKVNNKFWNDINSWADSVLPTAPPGLRNGWITSWGLQFYNLQTSIAEGTVSSMGISIAIALLVMLLTTLNVLISLYAIITIIGIIAITVGCLILAGWYLNILESIVMTVAVGLSIDFTMHYGVAYRLSPIKDHRDMRVRYSLCHIGSAVTMAAITTFFTGVMMMPSAVLVYTQLGQFLMIVMVMSWFYATFIYQAICALVGPKEEFGQLSITRCCRSARLKVRPEGKAEQEKDCKEGESSSASPSNSTTGESKNEGDKQKNEQSFENIKL